MLYETTQLNSVALATVSGINHGIAYGGGYLYLIRAIFIDVLTSQICKQL